VGGNPGWRHPAIHLIEPKRRSMKINTLLRLLLIGAPVCGGAANAENKDMAAHDRAPPIACGVRTQLLCIADGEGHLSMKQVGSARVWSLRDDPGGYHFIVIEAAECGWTNDWKVHLVKKYQTSRHYPGMRFDNYRFDASPASIGTCTIRVGFSPRRGGKPSYSEVLSNGMVLLCKGWSDGGCKQRFDVQ